MKLILLLTFLFGLVAGNLQQYYNYPVPPQSLYIAPDAPQFDVRTASAGPGAPNGGNSLTFPGGSDGPTGADDTSLETEIIKATDAGGPSGGSDDDSTGDDDSSLETEIIKAILLKAIENQTDPPPTETSA